MAGVTPARAFAATWRNDKGDVVATTSARTMCLWPRLPWRIRFYRDGWEGVIPCRECPGCLELERTRLAERLQEKYGAKAEQLRLKSKVTARVAPDAGRAPLPQLFVIRIWAPIELHASIAHSLHRRPRMELEPGMWHANLPREVLRSMGLRFRIEPLRLGRGRRAFRPLTAGLLVAREIYGEQRNRFYARGLPKADRQKWEVRKVAKYQTYDRSRSPRAWSGRGLVLVPPEVWQLSRTDRRSLRGQLLRASDPEGVRRVMGLVAQALGSVRDGAAESGSGSPNARVMDALASDGGRSSGVDRIRSKVSTGGSISRLPSDVSATAEGRSGRRHSAEEYQKIADRGTSTTAPLAASGSIPPFSEMGGYTSSEHSQGELLPKQLAEADRIEWRKGRAARALAESLAIIERMRKKTLGEG